MTYAATQALHYKKQGVWLYEITRGAVTNRYHAGRGYTALGHTWQASPLRHSGITESPDIQRSGTQVIMPSSDALAQSFIGGRISSSSITIRHGYKEDSSQEFVTLFSGLVVSAKPSFGRITLNCVDELVQLRRGFSGPVFQRPCWKTVYRGACRLNADDFYAPYTASALNGRTLTVSGANGQENGFFTAGLVRFGGNEQWLEAHNGNFVTMIDSFPELETALAGGSQAIELAPGCPKTKSICDSRFSNVENFGGFEDISNTYNGQRTGLT